MPSDPLTVFQTTYTQAVAQGLPTGAAQLAAQSAMDAIIAKQNGRQVTVAAPVQSVASGRTTDSGPTQPPKRSR